MEESKNRSIFLRVLLRAVVTCFTAAAVITACGRAQTPSVKNQSAPSAPAHHEPAPSSPAPLTPSADRRGSATAEPEPLEGSGRMAWAKGLAGYFIAGLDGGLYEPYRTSTIERVQQSLRDRGLYAGPINGILDSPTMKALFTFQQATHNLQLCGVPTPRTRKLLQQGSHTDVVS